jgi:signal transduction histidine kinase/AmiR/NasT family two-component response regulator
MSNTTFNRTKILHIDGNEDSTSQFRETYKDNFYIVTEDNHLNALNLLRTDSFNIILMDNLNPSFNESEFFDILDKEFPDLPVLYFMDSTNQENISHAMGTGRVSFINKNTDLKTGKEEIISSVNMAISRAELEEELKKEGSILQKLIELNPYAIAFWDANGYFIAGNRAYFEMFKIPPEHFVILRNVPIFENPILGSYGIDEKFRQAALNKNYISFGPIYYNSRIGGPEYPDNPIYFQTIIFKLAKSKGNMEVFVVMLEDITERINAQNELDRTLEDLEDRVQLRTKELSSTNKQLFDEIQRRIELEKELKLKNKELEDFAYRVSHDLRNRIIVFDRIAEIARREPERVPELLDLLSETSGKLSHFVGELLNQARAGKVISEMRQVPINKLVEYIFSRIKPADCNAELLIRDSFPQIKCDPVSMEQVFQNLISNSFQHINYEKSCLEIELDYQLSEDSVDIIYKDNGTGIDPDNISKVFNMLFTTNPKNNYGLGLSIVKKIIEGHNGRISVETSEKRPGTTFIISLPLSSSPTPSG